MSMSIDYFAVVIEPAHNTKYIYFRVMCIEQGKIANVWNISIFKINSI